MAITTTTWNTAAAQDWASATWQTTDPSYLLNTELSSWVNAINDTTIIEMVANPGTATNRADNDYVQWVLRAREADTTSDWGILFHRRYAGTSTTIINDRIYYNRTAGSGDNGYGSYSDGSGSYAYSEDFAYAGTAFVAYESAGSRPWFVYSWRDSAVQRYSTHVLMRLDTSDLVSGGYYPASAVSKWMYLTGGEISSAPRSPVIRYVPVKGDNTTYTPVRANGTFSGGLSRWEPDASFGNGYFGKLFPQFGYNHYLGRPSDDFLTSNVNTGVWGDTTTIGGIDYTCIGGLWVRTS